MSGSHPLCSPAVGCVRQQGSAAHCPTAQGLPANEVFRLHSLVCSVNLQPELDAQGVYGLGSYLNHACQPSTHISWQGRRLVLTPARDIAAGEEITFCFVPDSSLEPVRAMFVPTPSREQALQMVLKTSLGFECRCPSH